MNRLQRIQIWQVLLSLAMLAALAVSYKLWLGQRDFPLVPVADWWPVMPHPFDWILVGGLGLSLLLAAIFRKNRIFPFLIVTLLVVLALFDQNRWQSWVYFYGLMWVVLMPFGRYFHRYQDTDRIIMMGRQLMGAAFVWTGILGLNAAYSDGNALSWLGQVAPGYGFPNHWMNWMLPAVEVLTGGLLLLKMTRYLGVGLAISLQIMYLFAFGRPEQASAFMAWIHHGSLLLFTILLFVGRTDHNKRSSFVDCLKVPLYRAVLLLVWLAPALYFTGYWDTNLAAQLHPVPQQHDVSVTVGTEVSELLPASAQKALKPCPEGMVLDLNRWSKTELRVPLIPEPRMVQELVEELPADEDLLAGHP